MQQQAAHAYQQVAQKTVSPRELEANLLIRAALRLQDARDNWTETTTRADIVDALRYNRKLWQVFSTTVGRDDNPLPKPIRESIANLGLFVLKQTLEIELRPDVRKLDSLININREIAAGLRAQPAT